MRAQDEVVERSLHPVARRVEPFYTIPKERNSPSPLDAKVDNIPESAPFQPFRASGLSLDLRR